MPDTTVIIPTFDRAHLLPETITAVLGQTRPVARVLVMNDGSTDGTSEVLAGFADRIFVVNKPNSGKADTLNAAMRLIDGGLVWIVDDDDLPRPEAHEVLAGLLDGRDGADLSYGRHDRFLHPASGDRTRRLGTGYWGDDDPDRFFLSVLEDFFVHQPAMLADRRLYERAGPFDITNRASEDYDMLIRLARIATIASTDAIVFDQRIHDGPRGHRGAQWGLAEREGRWIASDRETFLRLRCDLPLREYLPLSQRPAQAVDEPMDEASSRQALLQRATIFARRKLWDEAVADLEAACELAPQRALSEVETQIVGRLLLGKFGCDELALPDNAQIASLRALKLKSPLGREIVDTLARALRWRVRSCIQAGKLKVAGGLVRAFLTLALARDEGSGAGRSLRRARQPEAGAQNV